MTAQPAHAPPSGGDLEAAVQAFPFWYRRIRLPGGVVTPGCAPLDGMVDAVDGLFEGEIDSLSQQNTAAQVRVDRMEERLERERERLLERFAAMEAALTSMNRLIDSPKNQIESAFGPRR